MLAAHDKAILRDLASRVAEVAALPEMEEKRTLWRKHNNLQPVRPMVLIFPEGSWKELLPPESMMCQDEQARQMERQLRIQLYTYEHFHVDNVVEPIWNVQKVIRNSGWGLSSQRKAAVEERGSWAFDPVIKEAKDLAKMRHPEITYNAKATDQKLDMAHDLFGDILQIRLVGVNRIHFHLMADYTALRGLEQVMLDMYEEPQMLHDAMAFLEEGHRSLIRQYENQNLLSTNNDNTYHASGGVGYTDQLPSSGFDQDHVRPIDMWASAQAQEMALVSPEMHEEFILQYERRLLAPFGLNGYGCCEDLTHKLDYVFTIPNIRRISISPFADVDACAEKLQNKCVFSWKPHPAHLVGAFDTSRVREYVKHTFDVAQANNCVLEIILKDTHTCDQHPERFDQWAAIVRELVGR